VRVLQRRRQMLRFASLVVFLAVGILIAWLIRNSGMAAGMTFLVAFVPALGAALLFERSVGKRTRA
jgi:hypothetical protein